MAKQFTITFHECEHDGDLGNYLDDMIESGANINASSVDHDQEIGIVEATVPNILTFIERFKETESFGFSSYAHY